MDLTTEDELAEWFSENFKNDFHLKREVVGTHIFSQKQVRIDFLAFPKAHLVKAGFEPIYFGIEIKYYKEKSFLKNGSASFFQAISYVDSEFPIKEKIIKPEFCLIFSNLSFGSPKSEARTKMLYKEYDVFKHLASHFGVGTIRIADGIIKKKNKNDWHFQFANQDYFRERYYGYKVGLYTSRTRKTAGNIQ